VSRRAISCTWPPIQPYSPRLACPGLGQRWWPRGRRRAPAPTAPFGSRRLPGYAPLRAPAEAGVPSGSRREGVRSVTMAGYIRVRHGRHSPGRQRRSHRDCPHRFRRARADAFLTQGRPGHRNRATAASPGKRDPWLKGPSAPPAPRPSSASATTLASRRGKPEALGLSVLTITRAGTPSGHAPPTAKGLTGLEDPPVQRRAEPLDVGAEQPDQPTGPPRLTPRHKALSRLRTQTMSSGQRHTTGLHGPRPFRADAICPCPPDAGSPQPETSPWAGPPC